MRRLVPWAMVWLRAVLCPVILWGARAGWDGRWLGFLVLVALFENLYDGVLARRWGCDTAGIRLADSVADTVFYLGVAGALWIREPGGAAGECVAGGGAVRARGGAVWV